MAAVDVALLRRDFPQDKTPLSTLPSGRVSVRINRVDHTTIIKSLGFWPKVLTLPGDVSERFFYSGNRDSCIRERLLVRCVRQ